MQHNNLILLDVCSLLLSSKCAVESSFLNIFLNSSIFKYLYICLGQAPEEVHSSCPRIGRMLSQLHSPCTHTDQ